MYAGGPASSDDDSTSDDWGTSDCDSNSAHDRDIGNGDNWKEDLREDQGRTNVICERLIRWAARNREGLSVATLTAIITFTWSGPRGVAGYTEVHACAWHSCQPVLSHP
jgi:hypothetical protein